MRKNMKKLPSWELVPYDFLLSPLCSPKREYLTQELGGYGSVYKCRHKLDRREYAIKKIKLKSMENSEKVMISFHQM